MAQAGLDRDKENRHFVFIPGGGAPAVQGAIANLTRKSRSNEELCYRMAGPVAQKMLDRLALVWRRGRVWDGA